MDGVLYKTLSENIQDETLIRSGPEDTLEAESVLSSTPVETENIELNVVEESNQGVNGFAGADCESYGHCESVNEPVPSQQKVYSPTHSTLIGSALKVMKNLFSPDKTKSKSTNISPVVQHQSTPSSPSSSICNSNKTENATSDTGIENPLTIQTGENSIKNQLCMNQAGVLFSPLPLESHNNTDESFLTTVSIIDDSFHSAITNLDENGEALKLEAKAMDSYLNSTQNSDVGDLYNDTLENTTLKNGSFASEGSKMNNVSVLSKDGNGECWSSSQVNGCNGSFSGDSQKISVADIQSQASNGQCKTNDNVVDAESPNGPSEDDDAHDKNAEENSNSTVVQTGIRRELNNPINMKKMENLFLNESFNTSISISNSLDGSAGPTASHEKNFVAVNGAQKIFELDPCEEPGSKESEFCFEGSNDERDGFLENSISTTTIVLNSTESSDLDNILMSLRGSSEVNVISSQISLANSIDTASTLSEGTFETDLDHFLPAESDSRNIAVTEANSFPVHRPQKNKSSISEKDSSGTGPKINKIKLHKSEELLNRRISSDSLEGKRTVHKKKSSLDVPLITSSEATKNSCSESGSDLTEDFISAELNIHVKGLQNQKEEKLDEDIAAKPSAAISVISQQSYTILTAHDKSLNRPVIEPMDVDRGCPEKHAFQTGDVSTTCASGTPGAESRLPNNYCNSSLSTTDSATPSQQKQSTPLWKGNLCHSQSENCQMVVKPISLNLDSPKESVFDEKGKEEYFLASSKSELSGNATQMFNSNEDPAEFSPVNPINENELIFSNSVESEIEGNQGLGVSGLNGTRVLSANDPREPNQPSDVKGLISKRLEGDVTEASETARKMNQTFDKSLASPQGHKLNQTFDKKQRSSSKPGLSSEGISGCEKLNVTFDKGGGLPFANKSNKTFTKETESVGIENSNQTYDVLESPQCDEMNKTFNKTFVSKGSIQEVGPSSLQKLNETFEKRSQSPCGKTDQWIDAKSNSSVPIVANETFVKEKDLSGNQKNNAQEIEKTLKVSKGNNVGRNEEGGTPGDGEEKLSVTQTAAGKCPNEEVPVEQSFDQQVSDYIDGCHRDMNGSFGSGRSSYTSLVGSELSTLLLNEESPSGNQSMDDLAGKLGKLNLNESSDGKPFANGSSGASGPTPSEEDSVLTPAEEQIAFSESASPLDDRLKCDPYLVQLIQEQFSSNDIEKICSVVEDLSAIKLSSQILKASEQFDKSFHENMSNTELKPAATEAKSEKFVNPLSPKSFDFLSSIQGKPTGRDWSRESLYVKFDPLVQPNPNSLIDFTKEGEALAATEKSPVVSHDSSVCEQLLAISPQKKPDDIVPPLTPLSQRSKAGKSEDKMERIKELQNEIYFLKNLYAERERANKAKMEDYESQVTKLTGESCFLEDKLKESNEREKALVKKMKEQNQAIGQLKVIMEEYVKVISKLTSELEALKTENQKQIEALSAEKDSYMTHLQNTEAAFTDVHAKYEKSKKTIVSLKANETMYRNTITEQAQKMEDFKLRAREAQEKALKEFEKIQKELTENKASHSQETARLRAQLRKTELKVEALQDSLEQKIKENQQLTAICDELIEGKK